MLYFSLLFIWKFIVKICNWLFWKIINTYVLLGQHLIPTVMLVALLRFTTGWPVGKSCRNAGTLQVFSVKWMVGLNGSVTFEHVLLCSVLECNQTGLENVVKLSSKSWPVLCNIEDKSKVKIHCVLLYSAPVWVWANISHLLTKYIY